MGGGEEGRFTSIYFEDNLFHSRVEMESLLVNNPELVVVVMLESNQGESSSSIGISTASVE